MRNKIFVPLLLLLVSCFGPSVHRGSLSGALEKSDEDYTEDRSISDSKQSSDTAGWCLFCSSGNTEEAASNTEGTTSNIVENEPVTTTQSQFIQTWLDDWDGIGYTGFKVLKSQRLSKNIEGSDGGGFTRIIRSGRNAHELELLWERLTIKTNSPFDGSAKKIIDFSAGYHRLRFINPAHTITGVFIRDGLDISAGAWKYNHPVSSAVYDEDDNYLRTDILKYDGILSAKLEAGAGIHFFQRKKVSVVVNATGGVSLYWIETFTGLKNDVLHPDGFFKGSVEVLLKKKAKWEKYHPPGE